MEEKEKIFLKHKEIKFFKLSYFYGNKILLSGLSSKLLRNLINLITQKFLLIVVRRKNLVHFKVSGKLDRTPRPGHFQFSTLFATENSGEN